MSRPVFHESSVGLAMVMRLCLRLCLRVYALVMGALCSVHFVLGPMFYVCCYLYEVDCADHGCRYLWVLGMDKRVKACLRSMLDAILFFLMVIFVYVGYLIHLDGC